MNKFNKAFEVKLTKTAQALKKLNEMGCAIINVNIGDNGNIIDILPPPKHTFLKAAEITHIGTVNGRQTRLTARLDGCKVQWQQ